MKRRKKKKKTSLHAIHALPVRPSLFDFYVIFFKFFSLIIIIIIWINNFSGLFLSRKNLFLFSSLYFKLNFKSSHFLNSEIFIKISPFKSLTIYHLEIRKIFLLSHISDELKSHLFLVHFSVCFSFKNK